MENLQEESDEDIPFFADATLDLEEAQGIALTPNASHNLKVLTTFSNPEHNVPLPQLDVKLTDASSRGSSKEDEENHGPAECGILAKSSLSLPSTSPSPPRMALNRSTNTLTNYDHYSHEELQPRPPLPPTYPSRLPRRSRDTRWIAMFCFVALPLLVLPIFVGDSGRYSADAVMRHDMDKVNLPIIMTTAAAILLARVFYLSKGGGEGEDRRYLSSQILIIANIVSCFVLPCLTLVFYNLPVKGTLLYRAILLGLILFTLKDLYKFAKLFRTTRLMREGVNDGERTFFKMMVNASLDVLSRSLRCQSFYRVVVVVILLQLGVILLIRKAIHSVIHYEGLLQYCTLLVISVIGYWTTSVCVKLLSYVACGGVTTWFAQQSVLVKETERMRQRRKNGVMTLGEEVQGSDEEYEEEVEEEQQLRTIMMPDAYREVDGSAYSLGVEFDEGMDDDYYDEDEGEAEDDVGMFLLNMHANGNSYSNGHDSDWRSNISHRSTVRSFLKSAIRVSFGSIVHCALLGAVANSIWSILNILERFTASPASFGSLTGSRRMDIGSSGNDSTTSFRDRVLVYAQKCLVSSKCFVRNHNDFALCHVAAYYKSYSRAANDVMTLITASGIEHIINEDISFHMCSSISKSISGIVVICVSQTLASTSDPMAVCEIMVVSYIMCYTILHTMMEPLRASIKSLYICFAQNNQTLSQVFPLVYHRLQRISGEQQGSNFI